MIIHLFTGTEGNSEFCGPRSLKNRLEEPQNSMFSNVPVVILYMCQSINNSLVIRASFLINRKHEV